MNSIAESIEGTAYVGHLPSPCPYLPGREASHLFLDGRGLSTAYRLLLDAGYRRHGRLVYRTDCEGCSECKIIRIPIASFRRNRSQQRTWKQGESVFTMNLTTPSYTPKKAYLYQRYLRYQHASNAEEIDEEHYTDFFVHTFLGNETMELQLHAGKRLAGVGILDYIGDALSAVYFFYDPEFVRYSPGTYAILKELQLAESWGLAYFYPGYYIADCRAMNYKTRFRQHEIKDAAADAWGDMT